MCLEFEPRTFGACVEAMVEWLRSWIFNQEWFQDRLSLHSFQVGEMSKSYFGNLNEKSALFPCSASVFVRQLRQIYGLRQFLATESPLNKMKMAFYFTLKAVFVFKFFKYLYCLFG